MAERSGEQIQDTIGFLNSMVGGEPIVITRSDEVNFALNAAYHAELNLKDRDKSLFNRGLMVGIEFAVTNGGMMDPNLLEIVERYRRYLDSIIVKSFKKTDQELLEPYTKSEEVRRLNEKFLQDPNSVQRFSFGIEKSFIMIMTEVE
ncbi:hypothetical protein A3F00_03410 [Candidatus Daviesbacteria bacterium RIFCSPHIGHO2_12_FULL_37_11]|uniref:Uncharacterized protein n=1 Tax=Candidatus Daviesbacteria bacterium RIFCSPHIGHO2_12_FULL_37_11 TaxID=1797777 RepID=A0A1F5KD17_9BACT|nr:MAG: hypothetical protein A3F00_03410 [Candidatus Daviesbacteria bacterium RIFCSPHIGHO2_12_FULL_37_11]